MLFYNVMNLLKNIIIFFHNKKIINIQPFNYLDFIYYHDIIFQQLPFLFFLPQYHINSLLIVFQPYLLCESLAFQLISYLLQFQTNIVKNKEMNDNTFEEYVKTLKSFYIKTVKNHSNMLRLSRNFMQMIQDISKSDNNLQLSALSRRKSQNSISGASNTSRGAKSLRNLSNIKSKGDYIFSSNDFKRVILFSYIHHIIKYSFTDIFNLIEAKSKLLMQAVEQSKINDKNKWQRCVKQWRKVMQLMNHKTTVRWEKILATSVTTFQQDFMDVGLRSIMHSSSNIQNVLVNISGNFQQISALLKIGVYFQQHQRGKIIRKVQFGDQKNPLKLGYIKNEDIYVYYDKLPTQKKQNAQEIQKIDQKTDKNFLSVSPRITKTAKLLAQNNSSIKNDSEIKSRKSHDDSKQINGDSSRKKVLPNTSLKKKNLRVIEALLREYNSNTLKLSDLQCFESEESKDVKIKKMLQNRRKMPSQ